MLATGRQTLAVLGFETRMMRSAYTSTTTAKHHAWPLTMCFFFVSRQTVPIEHYKSCVLSPLQHRPNCKRFLLSLYAVVPLAFSLLFSTHRTANDSYRYTDLCQGRGGIFRPLCCSLALVLIVIKTKWDICQMCFNIPYFERCNCVLCYSILTV